MDKEMKMLDVVMDAAGLASVGTMVGSAGVMVMDDSRDMVWALNNLNQFYANESCGQYYPAAKAASGCRKITTRMLGGRRGGAVTPNCSRCATISRDAPCARLVRSLLVWPTQSFP